MDDGKTMLWTGTLRKAFPFKERSNLLGPPEPPSEDPVHHP
jgi:hypothetical protein